MTNQKDDETIGSFGAALGTNILIILGTVAIGYLFPDRGGNLLLGHMFISFFGGIILMFIDKRYSAIGKGIFLSSILVLLVGFSYCLANPIISH